MSACRRVAPLLEPFVDGELATDKILEVEQHLAGCQRCCSHLRLSGAVRTSLRRAVRGSVTPSVDFQQRVAAALAAEQQRERAWQRPGSYDGPSRLLPWRVIVPVAAAAAVVLASAAAVNPPAPMSASLEYAAKAQPASLAAALDQLIEELVSYHVRGAEPEVREVAAIQKMEKQVGLPLRVPSFTEYGAHWEGGSLLLLGAHGFRQYGLPWQGDNMVPWHADRAASLHYRMGPHRITVYVYDASRMPLRGATLEPRVVHNMPVYVGMRHGYSVAATERSGVGYAAAADLNDAETAELVAATSATERGY